MIVEIAVVVTAIATACGAFYARQSQKEEMNAKAPTIRIHKIDRHGDLVMLNLSVFPATQPVVIRRISAPKSKVSLARIEQDEKTGSVSYEFAHDHSDFVDVDFDLLPVSISSKPVALTLSLRLRKKQNSVQICFHTERRRFATTHKVKAMISNDTD